MAALIQKALRGPQALPALTALRMATIDGARALGLGKEVGSIETGKRADMILVNLDGLHTTPRPDLVSTIVYAAEASDVDTTIIDGRVVMRQGRLTTLDEGAIIRQARDEAARMQHVLNRRLTRTTASESSGEIT